MKKILPYFFSILVSGCITVPRIQSKDTRNNQFSQKLQNWFYVAHPQKIDTQTKVKSDTTFEYEYDSANASIGEMGWGDSDSSTSLKINNDSILDSSANLHIWGRNKGSIMGNLIWTTWQAPKPVIKKVIITIHDSITRVVVDHSQADALGNQLKASRDSLTTSTLLVATTKNSSLKRLIWALIASLAALVFLILFLKKSIL